MRLGTSVLTPTLRYQPAVVAHAFATMGCLAPGRVFLGIGSGESMNESPVIGVEWPKFKERSERLEEAVTLIKLLVERGAGHVRGALLPDGPGDRLRPAGGARADLHRCRRAEGRGAGGPDR